MQHGTPKLKKGSIRMLNPTLPQAAAAAGDSAPVAPTLAPAAASVHTPATSPPASDLGLVVDDGEAGSVQ